MMRSTLKLIIGVAIPILLLTPLILIDKDDSSESVWEISGCTQNEIPTIECILISELAELSLDSEVKIVGISYYENIDAIVIGLEKNTYSDNEHLRNSMIGSILEIMPIVLNHSEELSGKKIVFIGSSTLLNAGDTCGIRKVFHTEIKYDEATQIDWINCANDIDREQLLTDNFESIWWDTRIKTD
ncbi:MAG: hypothetical protein K8R11_09480 [Methanococcoides sp.]|nr:hypothetical protein [Methanococcoides sp.]